MRAEYALGAHRMSHSREAHREPLHHSLDTSCNTALQHATRARQHLLRVVSRERQHRACCYALSRKSSMIELARVDRERMR